MEIMEKNDELGRLFLDGLVTSFRYHKDLAERAMRQLPPDQLRVALDANTNSIAVIAKHVAGNLRSRWTDFLTSDGEKAERNRDGEFQDTYASPAEMFADWEEGWGRLFATLAALGPEDLVKRVTIRGESLSVPLAAQRSLAHTSYHVGQIVLVARVLAGDHWTVLTIPRGASAQHNQALWGKRQYGR